MEITVCKKQTRERFSLCRLFPQCVKNLNNLICRFYFLDGKAKAIGVDPSATVSDVLRVLADKIELKNVDGWALYEVSNTIAVRDLILY